MAQAILAGTRADPIPGGDDRAEVRVTQPVAMALVDVGARIRLTATANLEALTLADGELTPGAWGEGFVDRRHPHTVVHELTLGVRDLLGSRDGAIEVGVVAGKGFVPFGTDDPMVRPFLRYPVNHHLAQLLERAVVLGQLQVGMATLEGALFNGDEPERPGQWPLLRRADGAWRFGDSRAARLTMRPMATLELQGSLAAVKSPEHRQGAGGTARKESLSARWAEEQPTRARYALVEWAHTSELDGAFVFRSFLAEVAVRERRVAVGYRFERTTRPEEERLDDPFRSKRPHLENSILGTTRWTLHTAQLRFGPIGRGRVDALPFIEATVGRISRGGPGIFDIETLYGTDRVRTISVGVVVNAGMRGHRMGRYGVLGAAHHHP
ncbi:MAG TPA: hypothetical protein VFN90_04265 [Gemmatimonadales bacterium]|nr:hypothetical protein [Gemmatimonadales bacterium]